MAKKKSKGLTYADAGVNFETHQKLVGNIFKTIRKTYGPRVMEVENGFGGLFDLTKGRKYKQPILVSCTDGVGTKLKLAFQMNKHDTVGVDCVAMSINDMLCMGAEPLFFLDYIATAKKDLSVLNPLIEGVAEGCKQSGCSLLGGETAEMPDMYPKGEYDIAGFAVGVVEKNRIIKGDTIKPGDIIVGIESSGIHSNGYSLVRKIIKKKRWSLNKNYTDLGRELGLELLEPTRIYAHAMTALVNAYPRKRIVEGIANITGGGFFENIPRILPKGCKAVVDTASWEVPAIFQMFQQGGNVERDEMYNVFNMGIGMTIICRPKNVDEVVERLEKHKTKGMPKLKTHIIGEIKKGKTVCKLT